MFNIFVAHPIGGDVKRNIMLVEEVCERLFRDRPDVQPLAPYLLALKFLNDDVPDDRARGITMNREFFLRGMVDELWLFGQRVSKGMWDEIGWARELDIPIQPHSNETHHDLIIGELKSGDPIQLQGVGPSSLFIARYVGMSERGHPIVDCPAGPREELSWGDIAYLAPTGVPIESPRRYL